MPTYDYQCNSCQHEFTVMHKISEPAPHCPHCDGEAKKKLSAPAVKCANHKSPSPGGFGGGCGMGGCGHMH